MDRQEADDKHAYDQQRVGVLVIQSGPGPLDELGHPSRGIERRGCFEDEPHAAAGLVDCLYAVCHSWAADSIFRRVSGSDDQAA